MLSVGSAFSRCRAAGLGHSVREVYQAAIAPHTAPRWSEEESGPTMGVVVLINLEIKGER
jgi:hypothetical protein